MSFKIIFTIIIAILLLRIFYLRVKANNAKTESFKKLNNKDKMAVLKECLLNNPTEGNLQNLKEFCDSINVFFDANNYRPFIQEQIKLAINRRNYIECDKLYVKECAFIDKIEPLEFSESLNARNAHDDKTANIRYLEGISRLYSDNAIINALDNLFEFYPKAKILKEHYISLVKSCDSSEASEEALEILRQKKESWLQELLTIE